MTREIQELIEKLADLENQIQTVPFDSLLRINLRNEYFSYYEKLEKELPEYHRQEIDQMIIEEAYKLKL